MAKTERTAIVTELLENLRGSESFVLANFQGLKAQDFDELRLKLRSKQGNCRVVKNTLLKRALDAAKLPGLESFLEGPTAVIFQKGDITASSKIVIDFAKDHEQLKIKVGCMNGRVLAAKEVVEISRLPGRGVLVAQLARGFNAPLQRFANVLLGSIQSLVFALEAVRQKKEPASPSA